MNFEELGNGNLLIAVRARSAVVRIRRVGGSSIVLRRWSRFILKLKLFFTARRILGDMNYSPLISILKGSRIFVSINQEVIISLSLSLLVIVLVLIKKNFDILLSSTSSLGSLGVGSLGLGELVADALSGVLVRDDA